MTNETPATPELVGGPLTDEAIEAFAREHNIDLMEGRERAVEMNDNRAHWAQSSVDAIQNETGTDTEDAVADLIGNLGHWCDNNGQEFANELYRGIDTYLSELLESGFEPSRALIAARDAMIPFFASRKRSHDVPKLVEAEAEPPKPQPPSAFHYERHRSGGYYVSNIRYSSGAVGHVANTYPDRQWRIVCHPLPFDKQPTFKTRHEAATAEWRLANGEG